MPVLKNTFDFVLRNKNARIIMKKIAQPEKDLQMKCSHGSFVNENSFETCGNPTFSVEETIQNRDVFIKHVNITVIKLWSEASKYIQRTTHLSLILYWRCSWSEVSRSRSVCTACCQRRRGPDPHSPSD